MSERNNNHSCSFCGKKQDQVQKLIAGPQVFICNECVDLCGQIINQEKPVLTPNTNLKPFDIKKHLDQYVIGQEEPKKYLSVAIHNHFKRMSSTEQLDKSNVLLLGPTGSGKTLLAKSVSHILNVPFIQVDSTSLTETGYVGEGVESIIVKLLRSCNWDTERAKFGVVYIDEIDKKAKKNVNSNSGRDISGEGVQQALLKLIEGAEVTVQNKKDPPFVFDTSNILFILGGAFVGLDKVKDSRINNSNWGFIQNEKKIISSVENQDLVNYGLIPELIDRIPIIAELEPLTVDDLKNILTKPKNAITKQFEKLFEMDNIKLIFDQSAISAIAEKAIENKTGVRGLRATLEKKLVNLQFSLPSIGDSIESVIITGDFINGISEPIYEFKRKGKV